MNPIRALGQLGAPVYVLVGGVVFDSIATRLNGMAAEINPLDKWLFLHYGLLAPFIYAPLEFGTFLVPIVVLKALTSRLKIRYVGLTASMAFAIYPYLGALSNIL